MKRVAPALSIAVTSTLALSSMTGCLTFDGALKDGRALDACEHQYDTDGDGVGHIDAFRAWMNERVRVSAKLVPHDAVARALGAPIVDYGTAVGVYALTADFDVARASADTRVELAVHDAGPLDVGALVLRMPPLVVASDIAVPPGPLSAGMLQPDAVDAVPGTNSGGGALSGIIGAFVDVGEGVGTALGAAIAAPIGVVVGIVGGLFGGLFGGGGSSSSSSTTSSSSGASALRAPLVSVHEVAAAPAASSADALLDPPEWQRVVDARRATLVQARAAAQREADRRNALLQSAPTLPCPTGAVCVVAAPGPRNVDVEANFRDPQTASHMCNALAPASVALPTGAANDALGARDSSLATPPPIIGSIVALDAGAPAWARALPASTADVRGALGAAERVETLACVVESRRDARDRDRTPPDLVVRVTAGHDTPRAASVALGVDVKKSAFVVPHIGLVPGERLRLSTASAASGGRNLGGAVVDFAGVLPIVVQTTTFAAQCTVADDEKLGALRAQAQAATTSALDALARAVPAGDAKAIVDARVAARNAIAHLGALSGYVDADVVAAIARLRDIDPAEGTGR
jgi:hypothetical protein